MTCDCGTINQIKRPGQWPKIPHYLYLGPDLLTRFKLYATPPEETNELWALPYSIRSFVAQASRKYGGCYLRTFERGNVLGEPVFGDLCAHSERSEWGYGQDEEEDCHMISGWTTGVAECPLWLDVSNLCQTEYERTFLHHYVGYARDRQFPMLIPQAWIGIADRRRPDFVMFVPLQHWNYQWLAIQLDAGHPPASKADDEARDTEVRAHGYDVVSLRPEARGYREEVRRLIERVEEKMAHAETDSGKVAVDVEVTSWEDPTLDDDLPF